jgi:pimeloyl-ACP methyl ester carboxylesterase
MANLNGPMPFILAGADGALARVADLALNLAPGALVRCWARSGQHSFLTLAKAIDMLMYAFLPGVGDWRTTWLLRDLWHFHFYGPTPLALVTGRERIYFEHFWNDFAADKTRSVAEADRRFYAIEYAKPGHMKAGMEYFRNFEQDAETFAQFAKTPLPMPMLVLAGEKASGESLLAQGRLVAPNMEGVIVKGSGHWLMEKAPTVVMPKLVAFLAG